MANYVECGYVENGYFEDDCSNGGIPAIVKVFGFARDQKIKPTVEDSADELVARFNSKYGRNAFAFPEQKIGK